MNILEKSFAQVCAEHDLTSLSVGFIKFTNREGECRDFFTVLAQHHSHCGYARDETIKVAIRCAIDDLNSKRRTAEPVALADAPLAA